MRVLTHTVTAEEEGRMVKGILRGEMQLSYTLLKSLKWRENAILLNGQSVHVNARVRAGDIVSVALSERTPRADLFCEDATRPDIVYEDEDLLVLSKRAGVAMHPKADDRSAPSLAAMLANYLGKGSVPHFVSRLDKGTSGLLIAAKSGYVHDRLARARRHRRAHRPRGRLHYPPLRACGRPAEPHGIRGAAKKRPLHAPAPAPRNGPHAPAARAYGPPRLSPRGRLALRHGGPISHRPPCPALV